MDPTIALVVLIVLVALVVFGVVRKARQQQQLNTTVVELFARVAAKHGWASEPTNDRKAPVRLRGQLSGDAEWELEYRLEPRMGRAADSRTALGFSDTIPYLCWKTSPPSPLASPVIAVHTTPAWLEQLRLMDQTPLVGGLGRKNAIWVLAQLAGADIKGDLQLVEAGDIPFARSFAVLATDSVVAYSLVNEHVANRLRDWADQPSNSSLPIFILASVSGLYLVAQPAQAQIDADRIEQIAELGIDISQAIGAAQPSKSAHETPVAAS